jgi:hypothetical protein
VSNQRWHHGNVVLAGDAAHTAHFTIGSGTKLAMEDAIALVRNLYEHADVQPAWRLTGRNGSRRCSCHSGRRGSAPSGSSGSRATSAWTRRSLRPCSGSARSSLLARVPPRGYYQLYRATEEIALWRWIWELVGTRRRDRYVRRRA